MKRKHFKPDKPVQHSNENATGTSRTPNEIRLKHETRTPYGIVGEKRKRTP